MEKVIDLRNCPHRVRSLSTNKREVEKIIRHRAVGGYKRRTRRASEEVAARVRLDSNKLTKVRRLKDRRQPLTIRSVSSRD